MLCVDWGSPPRSGGADPDPGVGSDSADAADAARAARRRTHDYKRNGTSPLFAALEIATGKVTGACKPRRRHQEFLAFLKQVARAYPDTGDDTQ